MQDLDLLPLFALPFKDMSEYLEIIWNSIFHKGISSLESIGLSQVVHCRYNPFGCLVEDILYFCSQRLYLVISEVQMRCMVEITQNLWHSLASLIGANDTENA